MAEVASDAQLEAPPQSSKLINGESLQGEAQALKALAQEAYVVDANAIVKANEKPELDAITGVPKKLMSYIVREDPKIYVVPNFVSDLEAAHLLELAEEEWTPSSVGAGTYKTNNESKDLKNQQSVNRTSYSAMLRSAQTDMVTSIEMRLAALAGIEIDYLERLNMVRYAPGQFFNKHHDGRFRPVTVFIYLNDLPDGDNGETFFPELGLKFKPVKGCAVMWRNTVGFQQDDLRTVHQGLPPKTMWKYGVNCFFNEKPMKAYEGCGAGNIYGKLSSEEDYQHIDPEQLLQDHRKTDPESDPSKVIAFVVSAQPKLLKVVPNMLSTDEVDAFLALVRPDIAERTQSEPDVFEQVEARIAATIGMPAEHMEPMKVSKCEPHMIPDDAGSGGYVEKYGCATACIFLNDADGGELTFPGLGMDIRPRAGTVVVWAAGAKTPSGENPDMLHKSRPPSRGVRYVVTCVFRDTPVE